VPWLTTFVTSDLSSESSGFATTTTSKPHSNNPLIVGTITILLRRGRVRVFPMLRSILFILHWACTPIIGHPVLRVFIPNPDHVNQEWKLTNTLVIHSLLHFRSQVVQKLHTFGTFAISSLIMGKVPHQFLKLGCIFNHNHVPLLELQELHFLLVPNIPRKVFLQKYPLEDIPGHNLTFSL